MATNVVVVVVVVLVVIRFRFPKALSFLNRSHTINDNILHQATVDGVPDF